MVNKKDKQTRIADFSQTPHPIVSYGTDEDIAKGIVSSIKQRFSDQFPHANPSNSRAIAQKSFKLVWRPNNYRRDIEVKQRSNSGLKKIETAIGAIASRHNKLVFVTQKHLPDLPVGVTLQLGKHKLTAIYAQPVRDGGKLHYSVESDTVDGLCDWVQNKSAEIRELLDAALFAFIDRFRMRLVWAEPRWQRFEDFIKGDDYLARLPKHLVIHDTVFKKVYGDGVEFIKKDEEDAPTVSVKNYIKNRAVENIAPEIAKSLDQVSASVSDFDVQLASVVKVIKSQADVNLRSAKTVESYLEFQLPKLETDLQRISKQDQDIQKLSFFSKEIAAGLASLVKTLLPLNSDAASDSADDERGVPDYVG
ncbi:hypothetical protein LCGC14_2449000 [marine sediment metagenome]|uniref:Uncharacterized protein n=1 Tax=marine sediment metagenome TaxID=412755 RepID=A0A0F9C486_9ZZZZ